MHKVSRQALCVLAFICSFCSSARGIDSKFDIDAIGDRNVAHKSIVSVGKEIAVGRQYADEIDKSGKLLNDEVMTEYVNRVAQNIARNSDLKIPLTVKVINAREVNAFALPGGFLYVSSGLLGTAEEEAEIAGVIGHEIAHVAARHWASQMTKSSLLQFAMIPLIFTPMSYPVYMGVSQGLNLAIPITFLKFSRSAESEADLLGLQYLYKSGYDPNAYVSLFGRLMDQQRRNPSSQAAIFSDHPMTADRIVKSDQTIKELLPPRGMHLVSTSEFDNVKDRLGSTLRSYANRKEDVDKPSLKRKVNAPEKTEKPRSESSDSPPVLRRRE